jgi:hypothetical protein
VGGFLSPQTLACPPGRSGFVLPVKQAWTLARFKGASKLPGYIAPRVAKRDLPRIEHRVRLGASHFQVHAGETQRSYFQARISAWLALAIIAINK